MVTIPEPRSEAKRSASNCRWAMLTMLLPAPLWFEAETRPWTCVRDAVFRVLSTTDSCAACPRWEPRAGAPRLRTSDQTREDPSIETPLARLERALIDDFVRARGYDPGKLADLPEQERERLLADASVYASGRLVEVEARSHFLGEIRDGAAGISKTGLE